MNDLILTFGKHKGKSQEVVFKEDPTYLAWALSKQLVDNSKWVKLSLFAKLEEDYDRDLWGVIQEGKYQ